MSFFSEMSRSVGDPHNWKNKPNSSSVENQDESPQETQGFFDAALNYAKQFVDRRNNSSPSGIGPVDWGNSHYSNINSGGTYGVNTYWNGEQDVQTGKAWYQPTLPSTSIDPSAPGTPTADGQFGALEDPSIRDARMKNDAAWMAENMPHLYGGAAGAVGGMGAVVGGIQNAMGAGNSVLENVDKFNEGMRPIREQWDKEYGDNYFTNPNNLANDLGSAVGSTAPIMALSALMPGAAVAAGTRGISAALTRAGLGRLANSAAGKALIEDVVRSPISTTADTASEYGNVVNELMQKGMNEEDARKQASAIIAPNVLLDTATIPAELFVMRGAKGIGKSVLTPKRGESLGTRLGKGAARAGVLSVGSGLTEGYQEGAQTALENQVKGERDSGWYSPASWNDEEWQAARGGFAGGALLGVPGNIATAFSPEEQNATTGNAMKDAVIRGYQDEGMEPQIGLAMAARESGGDDVNAIHMADNGGLMQITEESARDYGVNETYPNWRTDPYENARASAYILKQKIKEQGGDVWDGVRAYNGAGPEADAYLNQVRANYENIGGTSRNVSTYNLPTQGAAIDAQITHLTPEFRSALPVIGGILNDMGLAEGAEISSAARTKEHNAEVGGAERSYHIDNGNGGDAVDIVLPEGTTPEQAEAVKRRFEQTGAFAEVLFHDAGSGYHLHLGGYKGGLNGGVSGGAVSSGTSDAENRAFAQQQRELDREYDQRMKDIQKDTTEEDAYQEVAAETAANQQAQQEANEAFEAGAKTKEEKAQAIESYLNSAPVEAIGEDTYNSLFEALNSNDTNRIAKAYRSVQNKVQTPSIDIANQDSTAGQTVNTAKQSATAPSSQNPIRALVQPQMPQDNSVPVPPKPTTSPMPQQQAEQARQQAVATGNQIQQPAQAENATPIAPQQQQRYLNRKTELMRRVPAGNTERIHATADDEGLDATYKVVPASDIVASHTTDYGTNPFYPSELQPRDRQRAPMQKQVEKMSKTLKPELLVNSQFVNQGAPVVDSRGVVLNGNGRTMAIQKAYKNKNDSAKAYKKYLVDHADQFGLTSEQIQQFEEPVLVRQAADDADVNAIINSTEGGARLGAAEQAKTDADKLKLSTLDLFVDNGNGEIMNAANREFRRTAARDIASDTDANAMYGKGGELTPYGADRVRNALFAKAYHDDTLLAKMSESTDNNSKNVMRAMIAAAPSVARINEGIRRGYLYPDYDISSVIAGTANTVMSLRDEGKPLHFYLQETSLFNNSVSESEQLMLEFIDRNKFKMKAMSDMYKGCCERIQLVGSPAQGSMFDETTAPRITLEDIVRNSIKEVEGNEVRPELSIFEGETDEGGQGTLPTEPTGNRRVSGQDHGRSTEEGPDQRKERIRQDRVVESEAEANENQPTGKQRESAENNDGNAESGQGEAAKSTQAGQTEEGLQSVNTGTALGKLLNDSNAPVMGVVNAATEHVNALLHDAERGRLSAEEADKEVRNSFRAVRQSPFWETIQSVDFMYRKMIEANANAHKELQGKIASQSVETKKAANDGDVQNNIQRGKNAIKEILATHHDVPAAMYRPETGDIDFVYGDEGTGAKKHKDGYGIAKILLKHGKEAVDMIPEVVARGKFEESKYGDRAYFIHDNYRAVVRFTWDGKEKTWLVTNFIDEKIKNSRDADAFVRSAPTADGTISPSEGSISTSNVAQTQGEVNETTASHEGNAQDVNDIRDSFALRVLYAADPSERSEYGLKWKKKKANNLLQKYDLEPYEADGKYYVKLTSKDTSAAELPDIEVPKVEYDYVMNLTGKNEGGNSNAIIDSAGPVAARPGEGTHQNELGETAESGRPGRSNGQGISSSEEGRTQLMGDVGVSGRGPAAGGTAGNRRVQTQKSDDNARSAGSPQLSRGVRAGLEGVPADEQRRPADIVEAAADGRADEANRIIEEQQQKIKDAKRIAEIRKEVPVLLPEQAEDVLFAEKRLLDNDKNGVLFTNGTGTGKTFSGMGIVKRMYDRGKKNILIVAPGDGIIQQWVDAGKDHFNVPITPLKSTKDAGKGVCITTYSNLGQNHALASRDWDLLIMDESHTLSKNEQGNSTSALRQFWGLTVHDNGYQTWFEDTHQDITNARKEARKELDKAQKEKDAAKEKEAQQRYDEADRVYKKAYEASEPDYQGKKHPKVVFLSATPFAYIKNLQYAEGFLFEYPKNRNGQKDADQFLMDNFGYQYKNGHLERPGVEVDGSLMGKQFHDQLVQEGALHGRTLEVDADYDRGFIRVNNGIGNKIDEGFTYLAQNSNKYSELNQFIQKEFDYIHKRQLLEAIKAKEAVELVKQYVKSGKKVVVFHDYNEGGGMNPFNLTEEYVREKLSGKKNIWLANRIVRQLEEFKKERPDLLELDLNELKSPIETFQNAFNAEEVGFYNGQNKKTRIAEKDDFNDDNGKKKILVVQSNAGEAGISLHDTTGTYQRVLINLGMPTRPTATIQIEGRIYRVGNKSNAVFRYLNTGTVMEGEMFSKMAERSGMVEAIAMGEKARALQASINAAYEESQDGDGWKKYLPGSPTEGTGGKAMDYVDDQLSTYDKAKAFYFANQKKTSSNKSAEGEDYYATPEPLGLKMVEWADPKSGESMMEPSAGHGAIARWMPDYTRNTVVEPSRELQPKLQRNVSNANVVGDVFESLDLHNKFGSIVMNPPFGTGGKTAIEHLAKAFRHLNDGGRIVAIIPNGQATQKRFDSWFYGDENGKTKAERDGVTNGVLRATINLPAVTFERAGTKVGTKIVIIDRYDSRTMREAAAADVEELTIDAKSINELFDQIEELDMPPRIAADERQYSIAQKTDEELRRSVDELKAEIKEAFPGAKNVEEGLNSLRFEMPSGAKITVDMRNQIVATQEELDRSKQEHGYNVNDNVVVEGFAETHGKEAYIALSQGSRKGTGFHEAFHVVRSMALTDKEKAVLDKYYKGDEEKQANAYAEWIEARRNGHGTLFGKLWHKVQDMAKKIQSLFTGVENVHNVFRKMESGEIWSRDVSTKIKWKKPPEKHHADEGLLDTSETALRKSSSTTPNVALGDKSVNERIGEKYSVTNETITGDTQVPIIDVTGQPMVNVNSNQEKARIAKSLIGKTFTIIGSEGVGRVASIKDGKHLINSSNNPTRNHRTRRRALSLIEDILNNSVYVEKHPDAKHGSQQPYIELFAVVKDGDKLVRFRVIAKEGNLAAGEYVVSDAKFYDIIKEDSLPTNTSKDVHQFGKLSSDNISVAELLKNVKDRNGKPYVNKDGTLNYEAGVMKNYNNRKYSVRDERSEVEKAAENYVAPEDLLQKARDIVPIYTGAKVNKQMPAYKRYNNKARGGLISAPNASELASIVAMHVHNVLRIKGANVELTRSVLQEAENADPYLRLFDKNGKDIGLTPAQALQEGVSIFGRYYFTDPELARERFPEYHKKFQAALNSDETLKDKVEAFQSAVEQLQKQDVLLRARGGFVRKDMTPRTFRDRVVDGLRDFYGHWVDDTDPIGKAVKEAEIQNGQKVAFHMDAQKQALMARGNAVARATLVLTGGKDAKASFKALNSVYGNVFKSEKTLKDAAEILHGMKESELKSMKAKTPDEALDKYLTAMRTEELVAHDEKYWGPPGYETEKERKQIIDAAPQSIRDAAQICWDLSRDMVDFMEHEGLVTAKAAETMRGYKYYCPMFRQVYGADFGDDIMNTFNNWNKYVNQTSAIHRLEHGGPQQIRSPFESMIKMVMATMDKAERNNVGKALVKLAADSEGLGKLVLRDTTLKAAKPSVGAFSVWINGKKQIYRTTPELYKALTSTDESSARSLFSIFRSINRMMRRGATISPSFITRNFIRDTLTAGINSKTGFIPLWDSIKGMKKLLTDADFAAEFYASGGGMGTYTLNEIHSSKDIVTELMDKNHKGKVPVIRDIARVLRVAFNKYDRFANIIEDSTRAGEFARAREKGLSIPESGYLAKEVTLNFGRHGSYGKIANQYVAFFNATVQGTDKFIRAFRERPVRTALMTTLYLVLPTIGLWLMNGDDDWYKDLDPNTKYMNWCISLGDVHLLIPKPQEAGVLFSSGVEAALNYLSDQDPEAMKQWRAIARDVVAPSVIPTTVVPLLEWYTNYSFWRNRPIVSQRMKNKPTEYQYTSSTSEVAKLAGETGLISPMMVDNFISGYFASAGRLVANSLNLPIRAAKGVTNPQPAQEWYQLPFIASFLRPHGQNSEYVNRFYEMSDDMEKEFNARKEETGKKNLSPSHNLKIVKKARQTITKLNKDIYDTQDNPKLSAEQKKQRIDANRAKIRMYAKKALDAVQK